MIKAVNKVLKKLGPGFITGASDDDPSGIGTYSMAGAKAGFHFLWMPFITLPLMIAIQEMCARIALVSGRGLAGVLKKYYRPRFLYGAMSLLFVANTVNIGVDIGAMAAASRLFVPLPFVLLVVAFAVLTVFLTIFFPYKKYARYLKWLTLSLLAYIITGFLINVDWSLALDETLRWPAGLSIVDYVLILVAVMGTTISPYLFFWQASEEVEEEIAMGRSSILKRLGATKEELKSMRTDVFIGMLMSNIVMFFIIMTVGATLFRHGIHDIETAEQAALALKPLAGQYASLLFTLGIVGTGLLAVPVLAGSASYAVAETLHFRFGLNKKFHQAKAFYGVITLSVLVGVLINFLGINPLQALFYTAVLNGLAAPPLLLLILKIANNKKIMGGQANGPLSNTLGWLTMVVMTLAGGFLLIYFGLTASGWL